LNANKDPLTVIDGFERCLDSLPDATLSMIFDNDELRPAVDLRLRASPRLADRVRLVGRVPRERIATFYSAADLFVLGSHHEGSGYALIEACACGLWPVVTDIPPFRVITGGGAIGALWPPGNSTALADAMVRAADADPSGARKRVRAHFERELSWPVLARSAMVAYRDTCARRRRERA
jgi:glycosyltransferase involved in cell wall biosynthesis